MRAPIRNVLKDVGEWSKKYANLPDRFIERKMRLVYWKAPPNKPQYLKKIIEAKHYYFGIHRPWSVEFRMDAVNKKRMPLVEPVKDWSFFRGDLVEVLVGKDKGKQGYVKDIYQERNWVVVEGLNTVFMPLNKAKQSDGQWVRREKPLLVTNDILLVDPSDMKGTKIEWRYTEDGTKVRVSTRTGRIIPVPATAEETVDYKSPHLYVTQAKDTAAEDVKELTFEPSLKTFEMDIMDKMGIKEDRIPKPTFWY